jgi:hypothetical protein
VGHWAHDGEYDLWDGTLKIMPSSYSKDTGEHMEQEPGYRKDMGTPRLHVQVGWAEAEGSLVLAS